MEATKSTETHVEPTETYVEPTETHVEPTETETVIDDLTYPETVIINNAKN